MDEVPIRALCCSCQINSLRLAKPVNSSTRANWRSALALSALLSAIAMRKNPSKSVIPIGAIQKRGKRCESKATSTKSVAAEKIAKVMRIGGTTSLAINFSWRCAIPKVISNKPNNQPSSIIEPNWYLLWLSSQRNEKSLMTKRTSPEIIVIERLFMEAANNDEVPIVSNIRSAMGKKIAKKVATLSPDDLPKNGSMSRAAPIELKPAVTMAASRNSVELNFLGNLIDRGRPITMQG